MKLSDLRKYDPNQPRDDHGRWSSTGRAALVVGAAGAGATAAVAGGAKAITGLRAAMEQHARQGVREIRTVGDRNFARQWRYAETVERTKKGLNRVRTQAEETKKIRDIGSATAALLTPDKNITAKKEATAANRLRRTVKSWQRDFEYATDRSFNSRIRSAEAAVRSHLARTADPTGFEESSQPTILRALRSRLADLKEQHATFKETFVRPQVVDVAEGAQPRRNVEEFTRRRRGPRRVTWGNEDAVRRALARQHNSLPENVRTLEQLNAFVVRVPRNQLVRTMGMFNLPVPQIQRDWIVETVRNNPGRRGAHQRRIEGYPGPQGRKAIRAQAVDDIADRAANWLERERARAAAAMAAVRPAGKARTRAALTNLAFLTRNRRALVAGAGVAGALAAGGLGWALTRPKKVEKLAKEFDEAEHPRDSDGKFASKGDGRQRRAAIQRIIAARKSGQRIVYRGAPQPDFKPEHREHPAVYVTPSKNYARDAAPHRGGGYVTAYALPRSARFLNTLISAKENYDPHQEKVVRRQQLITGAVIHQGNLAAARKDVRRWTRDNHEADDDETDPVLEVVQQEPFPATMRMVRRLGYDGLVGEYGNLALIDPKILRPLYARSTGSGREIVLANKGRPKKKVEKLAKAAPKESGEKVYKAGAGVEDSLAQRIANTFGSWTRIAGEQLMNRGAALRTTLLTGMDQALRPLDAAASGGAGAEVPTVGTDESGDPIILSTSLDTGSNRVNEFARDYRVKLAGQFADEQIQTIQSVLQDATLNGQPTDVTARLLRQTIGLTPTQAGHVISYRRALSALDPNALNRALRDARFDRTVRRAIDTNAPLNDDQINRMVDAYQRRYLAYRATTIARTEGLRSANNGHVEAMRAYLGDNPDFTVIKTWMATHDNRTRPDHRDLDGQQQIGLYTPFVAASGDRILWPHHPEAPLKQVVNCRCTVSFTLVPRTAVAHGGFSLAADVPSSLGVS